MLLSIMNYAVKKVHYLTDEKNGYQYVFSN